MSSAQPVYLLDGSTMQMHVLDFDASIRLLPPTVDFQNKTYHQLLFASGYYINPTDEKTLLAFCNWYFPNVLIKNASTVNHTDWQTVYDDQVAFLSTLPKDIENFLDLQGMRKAVTLKDDVVGVHEDFSYQHFFRKWLADFLITRQLERSKILEFGCGFGQIILGLKKDVPTLELFGMDVSDSVAHIGNQISLHYNLAATFFKNGSPESKKILVHDAFDVVLVHAVLSILGDQLTDSLKQIFSLSKNRVLIVEPIMEKLPATKLGNLCRAYYENRGYTKNLYSSINEIAKASGFKPGISERFPHASNPLYMLTALEFIRQHD